MEHEHWSTIGKDWGFDASTPSGVFGDDYGRLWAFGDNALYVLGLHSNRFSKSNRTTGPGSSIMQAADGTVWVVPTSGDSSRMPIGAAAKPPRGDALVPNGRRRTAGCHASGFICAASDDSIGMESDEGKVSRTSISDWLAGKNKAQTLLSAPPVALDYANRFLKDREGSIWIGSRTGIDRFRRRNSYRAPFRAGVADFDLSLVPGDDGTIWAGVDDKPLMEIRAGTVVNHGSRRRVAAMYRDPAGDIWIGQFSSLSRSRTGALKT